MKSIIRVRVLVAALLPATLVAALLGATFLASRLDDLDATLFTRTRVLARQIAEVADYSIFSGNLDALRTLAQAALKEPGAQAVSILAADGKVLVRSGTTALTNLPNQQAIRDELRMENDRVTAVAYPITRLDVPLEDYYFGSSSGEGKGTQVGLVVVEMSRADLNAEKRNLVLAGFAIALGGLLLGALIAQRIATAVTRPIMAIVEVVERIGRGELTARVKPDADPALHRLEDGLNSMAARIESAHDLLEERVREATADLRRSEERLALVISGTSDGIWDWDLKLNKVYFSRRFQELLGYEDRDEFNRQFFFFSAALHPDDADHALDAQAAHLREGTPYDVEFRLRCRNGSYRWFRGRGQALWDEYGKPYRFAGSITDITQQKNDEVALRQKKEEAEQATQAKTRFLAAASHDLRQPLHALGMFVSRLSHQRHVPETAQLIAHIESSVVALQDLLDALLDISRLDAGNMAPNPRPFLVEDLLARMENDFAAAAAEKGLRLKHRPSLLRVRSDPVLLERIVMNLVTNALRYTLSGGVLIACRRRGDRARIEVRDSGVGIPAESQREIFKEFVRLDSPVRDRIKGLGLGLAICARMADLLGHRLDVRSAPGRGSVFSIEMPLASFDEPSLLEVPLAIPGMQLDGVYVALVDDDPTARTATGVILEAWGCQVLAAESGNEIMARCEASGTRPQLAICDYRLRDGETGILVADRLRSTFNLNLPCILVSGDTDAALLSLASAHKMPLLHKPVRPAKLRSLVQRLLANRT